MDASFLKVGSRPGWVFEQLDLVEGVPAHSRSEVELDDL